jgi:hypothetical protein
LWSWQQVVCMWLPHSRFGLKSLRFLACNVRIFLFLAGHLLPNRNGGRAVFTDGFPGGQF